MLRSPIHNGASSRPARPTWPLRSSCDQQRITAQGLCSQSGIENRLHFIRDVAYREDASIIRTGHGPESRAALRSLAVNQFRAAGHRDIAAGVREMSLRPFGRPLKLLGLS
ncbi:hypothetical protein [Streptomyces mirabilis]|uniref:hypothetical protein n=1 Tax=Streptomyces mirabilis TaxID=68239 RepID=UPI0036E394C9